MCRRPALPIGHARVAEWRRRAFTGCSTRQPYAKPMSMSARCGFLAFACLLAAPSAAWSEPAQKMKKHPNADHRDAHEARIQGRILPLREIERRVVPQMRGSQYIGFDFDAGTSVYTMKFLRGGNVIWVEVDGRSGQVIGRSGN
jgi:hypothetical protein